MSGTGKKSILLIYTGGTIGMKTDPETGVLAPFDFTSIHDEFPALRSLGIEADICPFQPIDSSNVQPDLWSKLARVVEQKYDEYDGFVVLHGTDTMSFSASALSYALENLGKPVVFTGSQIPIGVMRTDGRENLITAMELAAATIDGKPATPEVCLYFQNRLFRANRTTKYSAEEFGAFRSENYPPLAEVGVSIHFNKPYIARPPQGAKLKVSGIYDSNVLIIKVFPGLTEHAFRAMLGIGGLKGIVLETYGSGNAPSADWFTGALRDTIGRGVTILNVTQCASGSVSMDLYETGLGMERAGVISGRDITTEAAVTKLMYLSGRGLSANDLKAELNRSLRGEITE